MEHAKRLGPRTRAALDDLLSSESVERGASACAAMAWGTMYSRNACRWVVDGGGVAALVRFVRRCNRTAPHQAMLLSILQVFDNVLRYREGVMPVDRDLLAQTFAVLCGNLQYFRCDCAGRLCALWRGATVLCTTTERA